MAATNTDGVPADVLEEFDAGLELEAQAYEDALRQHFHLADFDVLPDYRLRMTVLSLAARGEPCVPDDPRPACKAWEKRQRAKAAGEAPKRPRAGRGQGRQPKAVPMRPSAQARREEWQKARAQAAAPAAPAPFTEPQPGEAGYGEVVHVEKPGRVDTTSLTTPIAVVSTKAKELSGGVNHTYAVTIDNEKYVFKPIDGEDRRFKHREDIDHIHGASLAEREVVASRIDQSLELNLAPATVMVKNTMPGGRVRQGALRAFVEEGPTVPPTLFRARPTGERAALIGVYDAIIGNLDRHGGNWRLDKNNQPVPIDHGLTLGESPVRPGTGVPALRSWALAGIRPGDIPVQKQHDLADRIDHLDWTAVLNGSTLNAKERSSLLDRTRRVSGYLRQGNAHLIAREFHPSAW